ncbi:hypothetical protein GCM10016234_26970 [Tianweitania populi]|uniref:Uncharacterized protein n=1 Tax=Tianweitania populi TaxID=1607949 RepID=A0A8J3GLH1_9HYPH|nr:hypothetical protein GCM10016234_26970 [Tianweitania populi]
MKQERGGGDARIVFGHACFRRAAKRQTLQKGNQPFEHPLNPWEPKPVVWWVKPMGARQGRQCALRNKDQAAARKSQ